MRGNQLYFPMLSPKSSEVWVGPGAGVEIYLFNLILIHVFFFTAYNIINIQTQVHSGETLEEQSRSQGSLLPVPGNEVARRERENRTG